MRLHAKVAVNASNTFIGRFPVLPCDIEKLCDEDHSIDSAKVREALRGSDLITWSSDDDDAILAFAVELMRQTALSVVQLENDASNSIHTTVENANERSLKKRLDKGKYASCRIDIRKVRRILNVRLEYANPQELIGAADASCRQFLLHIARVLVHITDQLHEAHIPVVLEGRGEVGDIFDEARFANEKCDAEREVDKNNEVRKECKNRKGDYCSPSVPTCPCNVCGRCVECKLDEKWLKPWKGQT